MIWTRLPLGMQKVEYGNIPFIEREYGSLREYHANASVASSYVRWVIDESPFVILKT